MMEMLVMMKMLVMMMLIILPMMTSAETCDHDEEVMVSSGQYHYEPSCSSQHISEALRSDVSCHPVPTVVTLPWPNLTHVQQMTPTHITVSR